MQSELNRILSSSVILPPELLESLNNNQHQLTQLQQFQKLLSEKNNQVHQLHALINTELSKTIEQNSLLKEIIKRVKQQLKRVELNMKVIKNAFASLMLSCTEDLRITIGKLVEKARIIYQLKYKCQYEQLKQQFKIQFYQEFKQKQAQDKKSISCQTQNKKSQQSIEANQTILQLQSQIQDLKKQNLILQNRISSFSSLQASNPLNEPVSPDQYSSTQSNQPQQKLSFILRHFATQFVQIRQRKYTGEIINDKKHGLGRCEYSDQFVYEGKFVKGLRDGFGQMRYEGFIVYKGQWKKGRIHGKGSLHFYGNQQMEDGAIQKYCGNFKDGKIEGYGTIYYRTGEKVRGRFMEGKLVGSALIQSSQQNIMEYGQFKEQNLFPEFIRNIIGATGNW